MGIEVKKSNLQSDKYNYTWKRDNGDGEYAGILDQIKVDKDEGYEVVYFITQFMNKHNLKNLTDCNEIENILQLPELSSVVMRDELIDRIELLLALGV